MFNLTESQYTNIQIIYNLRLKNYQINTFFKVIFWLKVYMLSHFFHTFVFYIRMSMDMNLLCSWVPSTTTPSFNISEILQFFMKIQNFEKKAE